MAMPTYLLTQVPSGNTPNGGSTATSSSSGSSPLAGGTTSPIASNAAQSGVATRALTAIGADTAAITPVIKKVYDKIINQDNHRVFKMGINNPEIGLIWKSELAFLDNLYEASVQLNSQATAIVTMNCNMYSDSELKVNVDSLTGALTSWPALSVRLSGQIVDAGKQVLTKPEQNTLKKLGNNLNDIGTMVASIARLTGDINSQWNLYTTAEKSASTFPGTLMGGII